MAPPEVVAFADEHVAAAGDLLAARHARHVEAEPLLPRELDFAALVGELWAQDEASGAVALRDGKVIGYLVGTRLDDKIWGPNVWVEAAGHAAEAAEDVRDLYAYVASAWVEQGRTAHFVYVPAAHRDLVDAWFRVGFGAQHALGIREVPDEPAAPPVGVRVREADESDVDRLVEISPLLAAHQALSPVFARLPEKDEDAVRRDILDDMSNPELGFIVAEVDSRIAGAFVVVAASFSPRHSGIAGPPDAALIGYAATAPNVRGSGVGVALTEACFAWARARGFRVMVVDWRVTNLLASRFWPRRGFRTTFLRLHRAIA